MNFKTVLILGLICFCNGREISPAGISLIQEFEGFYPNFYSDPVGIKTIGYGHACHVNDCSKITPPLTQAQGVALLKQDLVVHESCVDTNIPGLDISKFSALVSFSFNLGCAALKGSTLAKDAKAHNYKAASEEFGKWVHAGGAVLQGLVRRRAAEKTLFCSTGC